MAASNGSASVATTNGIGLAPGRVVPNMFASKVTVVLGAQWGDEGKGKVVDMLATDVDVVCRCQVSRFPEWVLFILLIYSPGESETGNPAFGE